MKWYLLCEKKNEYDTKRSATPAPINGEKKAHSPYFCGSCSTNSFLRKKGKPKDIEELPALLLEREKSLKKRGINPFYVFTNNEFTYYATNLGLYCVHNETGHWMFMSPYEVQYHNEN